MEKRSDVEIIEPLHGVVKGFEVMVLETGAQVSFSYVVHALICHQNVAQEQLHQAAKQRNVVNITKH